MALGTYVEIVNYVGDTAQAGAYYQKLGLQQVTDDVYTDGRYHLRVEQGDGANPTLRYYGCDLDTLKADGLDIQDNTLKSPQGVVIELIPDAPPLQLPHTDVMEAPATTRLGKFGELSIFVTDLPTEQAFWEACGLTTSGVEQDQWAWGIWTDGMMLIGIHEYAIEEPFTITHFHPDMKDVNATLKKEGIAIAPYEENKDDKVVTHATLMTPYGLKFYFFTGDINKDNP